MKGTILNVRVYCRSRSIDGSDLGGFHELVSIGISDPQGKGAVFVDGDLGFVLFKQFLAIDPAFIVHPVYDAMPAEMLPVCDRYFDDSRVVVSPSAGNRQNDPVWGG